MQLPLQFIVRHGFEGEREERLDALAQQGPGALKRRVLCRFATRYPGVELELLFPLMEDVTELLKSGRAQLGISYQKERPERELASCSLGSVKMPLVVSPDHPLARKTPLRESDLQGARQLMVTALNATTVDANSSDTVKRRRVWAAILMVMASAEYLIQK